MRYVSVSNLVQSILAVISSFRVHSCVHWIPHFPTSVVSLDNRQNGYGCFGSRTSSCFKKNTSYHGR